MANAAVGTGDVSDWSELSLGSYKASALKVQKENTSAGPGGLTGTLGLDGRDLIGP